jgi:hypothetical protein
MINLGALVNLTDVHGSTPFMDVLSKNKPQAGVALYARINNLGKVNFVVTKYLEI